MNNKTFNSLFTLALIARVAGVWIPQLWYDENFTLVLARLPFEQMMIAVANDVHPPLWYFIEWLFVRILPAAAPVWTIRIPSVILSLAGLYVFRLVMQEIRIPKTIQTGAMLLMVVLPFQLWYAQEARMYALLELEVLAALYFSLRKKWMPLLITSTAMLYTQNYSLFYLACIGLVSVINDLGFLKFMKRNFTLAKPVIAEIFYPTFKTAGIFATAAVLYLPWVKVLSGQMSYIGGRYWIQEQHIGDLLNIVYKLFWASAMPGFALFSALMITFMAISIGLLHLVYDKHKSTLIVLAMAFGPLALAWLVSLLWHPVLLHRPLIGASPFLYIIAVWPLGRLFEQEKIKNIREAIIAIALIAPILISGTGAYYKNIPAMKNDGAVSSLVDALAYVKANWQEGDVIYYTDDGPAVNLLPYAGDLPQFGMAACGNENYGLVLGSLNPATREAMGIAVRDFHELSEFKRVWVFAPRSPLHPKCYEEQIDQFASEGAQLITVDDNVFISSGVWLITQ